VPDPRKRRGVRHKLDIVLTIFVLALLCDQNDFVRVEDWAKSEFETLKQIMPLPHGIPSHDTFMRVIGALPVESVESLFVSWICECCPECSSHLAIDGKTVNGTLRTTDWESEFKEAQKNRVHVVSVFDCNAFQVVRQQIMPDKGGELHSAMDMLAGLDLHGKMVTGDAGFCNAVLSSQIAQQGGDFCFEVKDNQRLLKQSLISEFDRATPEMLTTFVDDKGGHGRIERREYRVLSSELSYYLHQSWAYIRCLIEVQSYQKQKSTGKETTHTRYYVSNKPMTAQEASETVRGHWHIEAGLHAVLDGTFNEDVCKSRQKRHAQNLVVFRHLVFGILRKHEDKKHMTVSMKRTHCRNDLKYRVDVLEQAFERAI
jgi:predicted transposase YbfD/YdcC